MGKQQGPNGAFGFKVPFLQVEVLDSLRLVVRLLC